MSDGADGARDVARKAADIGALRYMRGEGDGVLFLPGTGRGTIRRMVEGHRRIARRIAGAHACTCPSTSFAGSHPPTGEDRNGMDIDAERLHAATISLLRQVIGDPALDIDRQIVRAHLVYRPGDRYHESYDEK